MFGLLLMKTPELMPLPISLVLGLIYVNLVRFLLQSDAKSVAPLI